MHLPPKILILWKATKTEINVACQVVLKQSRRDFGATYWCGGWRVTVPTMMKCHALPHALSISKLCQCRQLLLPVIIHCCLKAHNMQYVHNISKCSLVHSSSISGTNWNNSTTWYWKCTLKWIFTVCEFIANHGQTLSLLHTVSLLETASK